MAGYKYTIFIMLVNPKNCINMQIISENTEINRILCIKILDLFGSSGVSWVLIWG
jgi:hypothetical protein